jgi:hypothetical protein
MALHFARGTFLLTVLLMMRPHVRQLQLPLQLNACLTQDASLKDRGSQTCVPGQQYRSRLVG